MSLPQVLHLIGGSAATKFNRTEAWLHQLIAKEANDDMVMNALFLRTLARWPSSSERAVVKRFLADKNNYRDSVYRDLFWAILNSKEFSFNH